MEISKAPSRQTTQGSPDWFIGSVQVEQLFPPRPPARTSAGKVTFEPGSRNSWHTHPLGQTLIITYGTGWVQEEGKPTQEVHRVLSIGTVQPPPLR
jgi:quercetin dioxygenase-like cupin family protein